MAVALALGGCSDDDFGQFKPGTDLSVVVDMAMPADLSAIPDLSVSTNAQPDLSAGN